MLLLRHMPRLEATPANAAFRRFFYSKWGLENCLISGHSSRAEYPPYVQRLSIKAAWGGAERYHIDGRSLAVDDDSYLVLNDVRRYSSSIESPEPIHSFSIFFRPGMAEEVFGTLTDPPERLLEHGFEAPQRAVQFSEQLRPHDRIVSPLLREIARQIERGCDDEAWYEEQLGRLLEAMLQSHRGSQRRIDSLAFSRAATRREMVRRVALATDFVHSSYARPILVEDMARAAHLSKYHFIRVFRSVQGVSPYEYLRRKRIAAARRLLDNTQLPAEEIARRVGFDRTTLFRNLSRTTGKSARTLRGSARLGAAS